MDFHHAGIATDDADGLAELYGSLLDVAVVHEETLEQLRAVFLETPGGYLELLEPIEPEGPIASFLADTGPGVHHLAFATDDVAGAIEHARTLDIEPIDDAPRPGAWGHDVAFLHPSDTGGVLVEFVGE